MDGKLVLLVLAIFLYIKHTKRYRSKVRSVLHRQVLFLVRERYFARVYTRLLELHALPPPPFYYALLLCSIRSCNTSRTEGCRDIIELGSIYTGLSRE